MSSRNRITNFVTQGKDYAEQHLKNAQTATPNMPKRFSGFLSAKSAGFIHVYQYSNNRLIGCIVLHQNNVKSLENTINNAFNQIDMATVTEQLEEETIVGDTTESE